MGRILTTCATLGSIASGVAWLVALVYMVEWYKVDDAACQSSSASTPVSSSSSDPLSHILSLEAFCLTSLALSAVVLCVFFLQLFYHERLAHEVLLEELADAAASNHIHSLLASTLCSSFTHTLLLLFNILITLTLILLCFLGLSALTEAAPHYDGSSEQQWAKGCTLRLQLGVYLVALDFLAACMFFVATGWRCLSRCWTDDDSQPTTSGPGSGGSGVGGLLRGAAEGRGSGADKKGKGRGNKGRNVKYSAVEGEDEADDDELFDAAALDGGDEEGSDIQRGGLSLAAVHEDDVEMMDMLDANHSKAKATGPVVAGKPVPSILPPPRVKEEKEEEKSGATAVGLPGDVDTEDDYDYGDVEEDDEEEKQK